MQLSYRKYGGGFSQGFYGLFRCLRKAAHAIRGYENPTRRVEATFGRFVVLVLQDEHEIRGPSIVEHIPATAKRDLVGHAEQDMLVELRAQPESNRKQGA